MDGAYSEAAAYLSWPAEARHPHWREPATERGELAFTYLPLGAEPLYDAAACPLKIVRSTSSRTHIHMLCGCECVGWKGCPRLPLDTPSTLISAVLDF